VKILTEVAVEGTANYIEGQRVLLDLAQQENQIVMEGIKERLGGYDSAVAMTNVIRRSIDTFVEMQQNFLVLASKRTQGWLQPAEEGKAKDGYGLVGIASEAMDEFVSAQQKFFDVLSEETKAEGAKKEHVGRKASKAELASLGREAAESVIDAQKKLLDLVGQQVNVNMQAAGRAFDLKMPIRLLPMADMAGESVKSFVDAEKALLKSMSKSRVAKEPAAAKRAKGPVARAKGKTRAARSAAATV
jgi:hypothetical protein